MTTNSRAAKVAGQAVMSMHFPDYFDHTPAIPVYAPLAALLGAPTDGRIDYVDADGPVRFRRRDTGAGVSAWFDPAPVPMQAGLVSGPSRGPRGM